MLKQNLMAENIITESFFSDALKGAIKIHIPMIVSNDLEKVMIRKIMNSQQNKFAEQLKAVIQSRGMSLFKSTGKVVKDILTENGEFENCNCDFTIFNEAFEDSAKHAKTIIKRAQKDDSAIGLGVRKEKVEFKDGALYQTDYTALQISSKNVFGKIIKAVTDGKNTIDILIKVYAVSIKSEVFSNSFKIGSSVLKANKTIERRAKDSFSIFTKRKKATLSTILTSAMLENKTWKNVLIGRKVGSSVCISSYIEEELKYAGIDLQDASTMRRLVETFGVFDFFIVKQELEEIWYLDQVSMQFDAIPYSYFSGAETKTVKIDLA